MSSWRNFRHTGENAAYINVSPHKLSIDDVKALNAECANQEMLNNKTLKKDFSQALMRHFGDKAFHLYEFGPSHFPIKNYFSNAAGVSYFGIDVDPACIDSLKQQNISAGTWDDAFARPQLFDRPTVCASVYALHFMVGGKQVAPRIDALTSDGDGFFVGNLFAGGGGRGGARPESILASSLEADNMISIVLNDRSIQHSTSWIIGKKQNAAAMVNFVRQYRAVVNERTGIAPSAKYSLNFPD